jgi:hypothetical protein
MDGRPLTFNVEGFGEGLWLRGRSLAGGIAVDSGDVSSEELVGAEDPWAAYVNYKDCVKPT